MPAFSAVLITFNEERDLPRALAPLQGLADEILVVDSLSSDRSVEIARQFGARVIVRPFVDFADQKNFAASQAAHDWVLVIDADEVLSPELRASLAEWKRREPDVSAYRLARKTNYLGRWIHHSGWYPQYIVRLYRRDRARFAGAIHESVAVERTGNTHGMRPERKDGPSDLLAGDLLHYSIRTLAEHYAKQEAFTTRAAEDLYARGRRKWRAAMWIATPWTFFNRLLPQRGFLDGYRGLLIAWTSARYVWLKYRKLGILTRGGRLEARSWPQAGDA